MPRPQVDTALIPQRSGEYAMKRPSSIGDGRGLQEVKDVKVPPVKEHWQMDAYSFTESVGELGYVVNLKANTLAECKLRPEVRKPGTDEWEETDDPRVLRVMAAFKPQGGDQGELLRQATMHWEIAGEGFLIGQPVSDEFGSPTGFDWEFLSTLECRIEGDGKIIHNAWGGSKGREEIQIDAYWARLLHRDARYSERADSPVRRILPILRELVLLTQAVDAVVKSRLSAGIFFAPWEVSPASQSTPNEWEDPGNPDSGFDDFNEELDVHLNAPITDHTAASSLHPLLMRGPAKIDGSPTKDLIGLIDLARPLDGIYKELRQESLSRMAAGLDIPAEIMNGKAGLSGLGGGNVAASIDADFIAKHVVPVGRKLAEFVSANYMRPMLVTFEGMEKNEADWFRVALDTSPIQADADRSGSATTGVQLEIISDEAWVRLNGLEDKDLASLELRKRRTLERLLYAQPTLGKAILPILYPNDPEITAALDKWEVGQSAPGGAQATPGGPLPMPGQPDAVGAATRFAVPAAESWAPGLSGLSDTVVVGILAASDAFLMRGLERAANRLISRYNGVDKSEADRWRTVPRHEVLSVAGEAAARKVGLGADELFHECWDELQIRVIEWLRSALMAEGAEHYAAGLAAATASAELAGQLTLLAASSLRKPLIVGANGYRVPTQLVLSALSAGDLAARD